MCRSSHAHCTHFRYPTDDQLLISFFFFQRHHSCLCSLNLQNNNYLTVQTQIRKKTYIVHFVTINNEEEKKSKLQQFTVFTIFVIVKITTVLILLKLRYS